MEFNGVSKNLRLGSFNLFLWMCIVATYFQMACAQKKLTEIPSDDLSIHFRYVAKMGETKKYYTRLQDIPNATLIPRTYEYVEGKSFYLTTETIDLGSPIVSIKVPLSDEQEFRKVRVLRLIENEMLPEGYEWKDCTISTDVLQSSTSDTSSEEYLDFVRQYHERYAKYLPDYSQRKVSCELYTKLRDGEYFALVLQTRPPPIKAFTDLALSLDRKPHAPDTDVEYTVILKNSGPNPIQELNFRSSFDVDTSLISVKPNQGKCKKSDWGSGGGSTVCYIGSLPAGASTRIAFTGRSTGMTRTVVPGELNIGWHIEVIVKEHSNDPVWPVNSFLFSPLLVR